MASSSSSRLRRYNRILHNCFPALVPCDRCFHRGSSCRYIADFSLMSCAECTRLGRPCVTTSISRLDRAVDQLSDDIARDEQEVQSLLDKIEKIRQRVARNKVVRESNNKRLEEQVRHAAESLPEESEAVGVSVAADSQGFSDPFTWEFPVQVSLEAQSSL